MADWGFGAGCARDQSQIDLAIVQRMPYGLPMADVESLIRKFADDLQAIVREQLSSEVTAAVQVALGGKSVKLSKLGVGLKRGRSGKRTPEEIEAQAEKLYAFISKNPDQRAEQIAKANRLSTTELVRPIKKLLEAKKIKASGVARGTTYAAVK
jgi:hypothetical protein